GNVFDYLGTIAAHRSPPLAGSHTIVSKTQSILLIFEARVPVKQFSPGGELDGQIFPIAVNGEETVFQSNPLTDTAPD
ncbi:hypothetical protein RA265_30325, partial [Pseudomonas syringae pv. tagetis]|uniref:hypothetical protein n=1 Tax=Pseudomonas syringae group genomosp. 7 TaxID=251699 RepID=UPI0037700C84